MSSFGDINWDAVREDADNIASSPTRSYENQPKINVNFWSPPEGQKKIRFLPIDGGEGKPYKHIFRHDLPYLDSQNNRKTFFILCWDYIARTNRGMAQPLIQAQRLTTEDIKLYKAHGCPICKAKQAMIDSGVVKQVWTKLNASEKYLFNLLDRQDNKCYVWTCSMTNGKTIVRQMDEFLESGLIPLDPKTGYDYSISADGVGMGRRYNGGGFSPIAKPIIPIDPKTRRPINLELNPYNLTDVAMYSFNDYQRTIQRLSECFGEILTDIGYVIPGDSNSWGNRSQTIETEEEEPSFNPVNQKRIKKTELELDSFELAVPPSEVDESQVGRILKKVKKPSELSPVDELIKERNRPPLKKKKKVGKKDNGYKYNKYFLGEEDDPIPF